MNSLQPLGDQAALAHFDDETGALRFAAMVQHQAPLWLLDVVQAYTSVAIFFDPEQANHAGVVTFLRQLEDDLSRRPDSMPGEGRLHLIPCCYDLQLDLDLVAEQTGLVPDEVIRLHTGTVYTIYAIGFCPGFPYLGYLPSALSGVPRLTSPRTRLEAGSVGLTGRQTGIYTEARPGGWNIIGRTPLELVNVTDGYFPLRTGDRVRFERIDKAEFQRRQGERL